MSTRYRLIIETAKLAVTLSLIVCAIDPINAEIVQPGLSVVRVAGITETGLLAVASGVVIAPGLVATNCHTLRRVRAVRVYAQQEVIRAMSEKVHAQRDVCVLTVPGLSAPAARIGASRRLDRGDPVFALGYPGERGIEVVRGLVLELFEYEGAFAIQSSASFTHGSSGGGLFDENGRLVGLLTFFRTADGKGHSYFSIPVEWLAEVLMLPSIPIAPIKERPFWAATFEYQPVFLQAGALEMAEMWTELYQLAHLWTEREPHDHNAWRMLAKAAEHVGYVALAETALTRSLQLAFNYP